VLDFGTSLFPDSEEIDRVRQFVISEEKALRLKAAKEFVRERPGVQSYLELADAYRSLGRLDQCSSVLRDALEQYGENGTVLAQLGESRLCRYLDSVAAADGLAAEDLLRRAIEVEPEALKPRSLLAELYYRVGGVHHAREQISALLAIAPEHDRAEQLRRELENETPADSREAEDIHSLLTEVEERMRLFHGRLPWDPEPDAEDGDDEDRMPFAEPEVEVAALARESMATRTLLIDGQGGEWGVGQDAGFEGTVRDLSALCHRAARGMELGVPARLLVEGESGSFVLEMKRGAEVGLVLPEESDPDMAAVAARDALERLVRG